MIKVYANIYDALPSDRVCLPVFFSYVGIYEHIGKQSIDIWSSMIYKIYKLRSFDIKATEDEMVTNTKEVLLND